MMGRAQQERLISILRKIEQGDTRDIGVVHMLTHPMSQPPASVDDQQERMDIVLLSHMGWITSGSYRSDMHQTWLPQGIHTYRLTEDGEAVLDAWEESNGNIDESVEPQRIQRNEDRPLVMLVHGSRDGVVPPIVDTIRLWCFEQGMDAYKAADHPNTGRFVHDKVDDVMGESDYYIVVLTPDEELKDGTLRPRPNPMIEMGRLLGIDATRVCVLKDKRVEMPSDYAGLVTERLDNWESVLNRELKNVGLL